MKLFVRGRKETFQHLSSIKKDEIEKNLVTLVKGLKTLEVPFIVNEQYKKGIGETIPSLREFVDEDPHFEKTTFSAPEVFFLILNHF